MTEDSNSTDNKKFCECGCGSRTEIYRNKPRRFIGRHNLRVRNQQGENNSRWKGGQPKQDKDGYWLIYKPEHPNHNAENRVFAHRLIYEHYLSIILDEEVYLNKEEEIHHINKNKEDNSLINLQYMRNRLEHKQEHLVDKSGRVCCVCGKTNQEKWMGNEKDGWKCISCQKKEYYIKNKERIQKYRLENKEQILKQQKEYNKKRPKRS